MPLDADIYGRKEAIAPTLVASTALHAVLLACILFLPAVLSHNGDSWGNNGSGGVSGEAMSAHLVSGIPLPPNPQAKPENVLANDSKGLSQSVPAPVAKEDDKAIAIPDRQSKIVPKQKAAITAPDRPNSRELPRQKPSVAAPSNVKPRAVAKVDNTVPFGGGGPVAGPYTSFKSGSTAGGMKFGEGGGNGSFGNLFGWYTDAVARKVHQTWQSEVNPGITSAKRVYILFDISRNGKPSNIRVEQSSGIPALDISAVRTLQRIDTFGDLPQQYRGSYVSVEFWFDYKR